MENSSFDGIEDICFMLSRASASTLFFSIFLSDAIDGLKDYDRNISQRQYGVQSTLRK